MSERKEPIMSAGLNTTDESVDRRARTSRARTTNSPRKSSPQPTVVQKSSSGFVWFTFLLTLIASAAAGYAVWQLQTAQQVISDQTIRILQLESKLALSDDSASQSLASVGVKVRELGIRADGLDSEIAKLWDTRKVNRNAIAAGDKKIAALTKAQETLKNDQTKKIASVTKTASSLSQTVEELRKSQVSVEQLSSLEESLASTTQTVTEQDLLLQSVRERLSNNLEVVDQLSSQSESTAKSIAKISSIDKRLATTEEIIESLEAFRRTTNRDIQQLKQPN